MLNNDIITYSTKITNQPASHAAEAVVEQAGDRKCQKYAQLSVPYEFQPVAVETHGP